MLTSLAKELMILRAFCVLIALSMGVLSPVMANAVPNGSELSANDDYALPDGTLQIICFGNGDGETENAVHCDDCLLTGNPVAKLASVESSLLPLAAELGKIQASSPTNTLLDFLKRQQSRAPPLI